MFDINEIMIVNTRGVDITGSVYKHELHWPEDLQP